MVMVPIFAAIYLRFLWSLPRRMAVLFVLAGAVYVGGALGLEMVGWHHRYPLHAPNPTDWEASKTMTYGRKGLKPVQPAPSVRSGIHPL